MSLQQPAQYIIDGSNIARFQQNSFCLRPLLVIARILNSRSARFICYFDAQFPYQLPTKRPEQDTYFRRLLELFPDRFCVVSGGRPADDYILPHAARDEAKIISNDRFREYIDRYPWLNSRKNKRLIKGIMVGNTLNIPDLHLIEDVPDIDTLFHQLVGTPRPSNPGIQATEEPTMPQVRTPETARHNPVEARFIILLLDASGSMTNPDNGACDTYDKRKKSDHLTDIIKDVVKRLAYSGASESFYIALINFSGKANLVKLNKAPAAHISYAAPIVLSPSFNYTVGSHKDGTNLGDALELALSIVDGALADPDFIADHAIWHATIILITDGMDTVNEKRVYDIAGALAAQRAALDNKAVTLGCVAIGEGCNIRLLSEIASEVDPRIEEPLRKANLTKLLVSAAGAGRPSLLVHVNEKDEKYTNVIRLFVDIVSSSA